jgi:dTDP-4-dehydrorhamnose reductase
MVWLVTGAGGQLGSVLLRWLVEAGEAALGVASPNGPLPRTGTAVRLDLTDASAVTALIRRERPSIVVHIAALASVAAAYADPEAANRINAVATAHLARLGADAGARFLYASTDMVFDGERAPYGESDAPNPVSEYGRSKREGELATLAVPETLVVRLPLMYGVADAPRASTFVDQARALREGRRLALFHDEWRTPLSFADAARSLVRAAQSDLAGLLHVAGPDRLSRFEMGKLLADALGVREPNIDAVSRLDVAAPEPRARDLSLSTSLFASAFGVAPGRPMREALAEMDFGGVR